MIVGRRDVVTARQTFTEPPIDRNADRSCVAVPYIQSSVPSANGRKLPCASFRVFGSENATRAAARQVGNAAHYQDAREICGKA